MAAIGTGAAVGPIDLRRDLLAATSADPGGMVGRLYP